MKADPVVGISTAARVLLLLILPLLSACSGPADGTTDADGPLRRVSVRVYYAGSTTPNVLVNVPLRAVDGAIRLATVARAFGAGIEIDADGHRTVRLDEVDLDAMRAALLAMEPGPILQVEEGDERVEIWID